MRFLSGEIKKGMGRFLLAGFVLVWITACASTKEPVVEIDTGGSGQGQISEPAIITDIITLEDGSKSIILVKGNKPLAYSAIKQTESLRLLFDFPETSLYLYNVETSSIQESAIIEAIKTSELDEEGNISRIEVVLKQDAVYQVEENDGGLRIEILKPETEIAKDDDSVITPVLTKAAEIEPAGDAQNPTSEAAASKKGEGKEEVRFTEASTGDVQDDATSKLADESEKSDGTALVQQTGNGIAPKLTGVDIKEKDQHLVVTAKITGNIDNYNAFVLGNDGKSTPRIVIDMNRVGSDFKGQQKIKIESVYAKQVRHYGYPDKIRLVLDTYQEYLNNYHILPTGDGLALHVGQNKPALDSSGQTLSLKEAVGIEKSTPSVKGALETSAESDNIQKSELEVAQIHDSQKFHASEEALTLTQISDEKGSLAVDGSIGEIKSLDKDTAEAAVVQTKPAMLSKPAWLNRIEFTSIEAGRSTLLVGTTRPIQYKISKQSGSKLALKLVNTRVPEYRKRPLITTRFNSAVNRILPVQTASMTDNDAVISIEMREMVPYVTEQSDTTILVHFEASNIPPKPLEDAKLPEWKQVFKETAETAKIEKELEQAAVAVSDNPIDRILGKGTKEYTGEKIALDFFQTDIKNVFRILREVSGKNFAIDKDVTGKVTLTLEKPVPWDQILDLVLKMNQLDKIHEGDIIRIATNATVRKEEATREAALRAARKAQEQAKALEPLYTEYIAVNYSNASSEILPHLKNVITPKRGKISVDKRNNQVIITDTAEKIREAIAVVKEIDKVTPQVTIEARIVEVNSEFSRSLGIEWGTGIGVQDSDSLSNIVNGVPDIFSQEMTNRIGIGPERGYANLGGTYGYNMAMNYPAQGDSGSIGFNFTRILGTPLLLNAQLTAIETEGTGKIISAPKIVTLDNKAATIKQGVEVPYATVSADGTNVEFKNVDLMLKVTPHVTPDERISLKINITKNDVISDTSPPALSTNEANTELLVNDGDTIVIGGIMRSTETEGVEGFPFAKDIPVLGYLFKSESGQTTSTELLIFITPKIVQLEQRNEEPQEI